MAISVSTNSQARFWRLAWEFLFGCHFYWLGGSERVPTLLSCASCSGL